MGKPRKQWQKKCMFCLNNTQIAVIKAAMHGRDPPRPVLERHAKRYAD